MNAAARRALLRAGRTAIGSRLLEFYRRNGAVSAVDAADLAEAVGERDRLAAENRSLADEARRIDGERAVLEDLWDRFLPGLPAPTFADLTEQPPDDTVPPLDRGGVDVDGLSDDQRQWWEHGYLLKRRFIPDEILDRYWEVRSRLGKPHGWESATPYMFVPEVRTLAAYQPLEALLEELIGEPMAVSLNLTGTVSTERNWHQDDYLNPPNVNGWYAAVWFAVGDIDPDSGPFQYVPGSHRWPVLRRDRVRRFLRPDERDNHDWPRLTERFLDELIEKEIASRGSEIGTFLGEKGDVLIWHARLIHRGSTPNVQGRERRSFIAHYTGVDHWSLGPNVGRTDDGGLYFVQDDVPDPEPA
jgi:hypothetical protein